MFGRKKHERAVIDRIARTGLVAKGIVYLLFGGLVSYAVFTGRQKVTDEQGAMTSLFEQPFGKLLLAILALGLAAYCLWRLYELFVNPSETEGFWSARAQPLLSAVVYGSLAVEAFRMIAGHSRGGEGEGEAREQAALVMSLPLGHWLLVTFGVVLVVSALYELWQTFTRRSDSGPENRSLRGWSVGLKRFGDASRGLLGLVGGGYLILSGFHRSPGEVKGSRGALEKIAEQPFGRWLLLIIALGLLFYGLVQLMEARYREIDVTR